MEIREIHAFVAVAEELNFRKAAERLHVTQPPLTRLISQLEYDLGVTLFKRSTRKVELTGAGLHLFKRGKDIIASLEEVEREVRSLQKNKAGKVKVAFSGSSIHSNVPQLINVFKKQFPKIEIDLMDVPFHQVQTQLKSGKVDIAFMVNDLRDEGLTRIDVQKEELGLLVPKSHFLGKKREIQLKDLLGETLIFHGKHDALGFQAEFLDYLKSKGISVQVYVKKPKEGCPHLVQEGKGLLLTSRKFLHVRPETVFVPFMDYSKKLKIYGVWSEENSSLGLKAFINFLIEKASVPVGEEMSHY